jgi:predicted nucleic acid-binding Zn ribbon protein
MNKACAVCGLSFIAKQSNYKTCSELCRMQRYKQSMRSFYENNRDDLIRAASDKAKRPPVSGTCQVCGAVFSSRRGTRCCSHGCRSTLNKESSKRSYTPTRYSNTCRSCEQTFSSSRRREFCSDRCRKKAYVRTRYRNDIQFKIADNLRSRLSKYVKSDKVSAVTDLGCSIGELICHIESQFEDGMTWENHGINGWHIDHIVPLCSFDLTDEEQLKKAIHYTNLRPLWGTENRKKGGRP